MTTFMTRIPFAAAVAAIAYVFVLLFGTLGAAAVAIPAFRTTRRIDPNASVLSDVVMGSVATVIGALTAVWAGPWLVSSAQGWHPFLALGCFIAGAAGGRGYAKPALPDPTAKEIFGALLRQAAGSTDLEHEAMFKATEDSTDDAHSVVVMDPWKNGNVLGTVAVSREPDGVMVVTLKRTKENHRELRYPLPQYRFQAVTHLRRIVRDTVG